MPSLMQSILDRNMALQISAYLYGTWSFVITLQLTCHTRKLQYKCNNTSYVFQICFLKEYKFFYVKT